jgi:hypothetical protein
MSRRIRIMNPNPFPARPGAGAALEQAWRHTGRLLFQPFDAARWFAIGFCAWLAQLGSGGFGGNFNLPGPGGGGGRNPGMSDPMPFIRENLWWLVPVLMLVVVVSVAVGLVLLWLQARGQMMFVDAVAKGRAEIGRSWTGYAAEAWSLFWFRLVVGLGALISILPIAGLILVLVLPAIGRPERFQQGLFVPVIALALLVIPIALFWALVGFLNGEFVVPILYRQRRGVLAAWGTFLRLASAHFGEFLLFLLLRLVVGFACGVVVLLLVLLTCCLAGCLLILPYIGTVLMLPVLVLERSMSLRFLAQFGQEHDLFAQPG